MKPNASLLHTAVTHLSFIYLQHSPMARCDIIHLSINKCLIILYMKKLLLIFEFAICIFNVFLLSAVLCFLFFNVN